MGFSLVVQGELHANLPAGPTLVPAQPFRLHDRLFDRCVRTSTTVHGKILSTLILPLLHNRDLSKRLYEGHFGYGLSFSRPTLLGGYSQQPSLHIAVFDRNVMDAFTAVVDPTCRRALVKPSFAQILAGWRICADGWLLPRSRGLSSRHPCGSLWA